MADYWHSDDELIAELAEALRTAREVPSWFVDAGAAAWALRGVDAELAELTHDSAVEPELAGVRSEPLSVRTVTFSGPEVTIEIEVGSDALRGQVAPPRAGQLDVCSRNADITTVPVDEVGWFVVAPKPVGLFQLRLRFPTGRPVITDWTTL